MNNDQMIMISVAKFKEILLFSWHLLPADKQKELYALGVFPQTQVGKL